LTFENDIMPLSAITFDLWETIIIDGSDEPKRDAQGLRSKSEERRYLFWQALSRQLPIDKSIAYAAFDVHEAAFRKAWYGMSVTWDVSERLEILLNGLGRDLPISEHNELIEQFETMELSVKPDLIEGAGEAIAELASRYDLCVISDTIYTPGKNLRLLLEHHGVAKYFKGFVFSDQVGRSKPHPDCFRSAAEQLGAHYSEMLHIGDRDAKDIAGAQYMGMKAILFTVARDEGATKTTKADAVVDNYSDLVEVIDSIAQA